MKSAAKLSPARRMIAAMILAGTAMAGLATPASAQLNLVRFEGYWDQDEKRTDAINWFTFAAHGHEKRKFALTHVEGDNRRGGNAGWAPQFHPVTNIEGREHEVSTFFSAEPGHKITVAGMLVSGGLDIVLNTVIVMTAIPEPVSSPVD